MTDLNQVGDKLVRYMTEAEINNQIIRNQSATIEELIGMLYKVSRDRLLTESLRGEVVDLLHRLRKSDIM